MITISTQCGYVRRIPTCYWKDRIKANSLGA